MEKEITSETKNLLIESTKKLKLLKLETRENVKENTEEETENENRIFYAPTKSVRISSTQHNDTNVSCNTQLVTVLKSMLRRVLVSIL